MKQSTDAVEKHGFLLYKALDRGVAQPGSASALGAECRGFESSRPDQEDRFVFS